MLHFVCCCCCCLHVCCALFSVFMCVDSVLRSYVQNTLLIWKNTEILFFYMCVFVSVVLYRRFDSQEWMTFLRGVIIHMEEITPTYPPPLPLRPPNSYDDRENVDRFIELLKMHIHKGPIREPVKNYLADFFR